MPLETDDLGGVYGAASPTEARRLYDAWAARYDGENLAKGYQVPGLGAAFLARHLAPGAGPVLDAGCGTGLVGAMLATLGYGPLTGLDLSAEMLAVAGARGVYARLAEQDLGRPIPEPDAAYAGFACFGSFGPGHAPPESLDELVRLTCPGGIGVFNVVEATWRDQGFPAVFDRLAAAGRWRERERSAPFRAYLIAEPALLCRIFVVEVTA